MQRCSPCTVCQQGSGSRGRTVDVDGAAVAALLGRALHDHALVGRALVALVQEVRQRRQVEQALRTTSARLLLRPMINPCLKAKPRHGGGQRVKAKQSCGRDQDTARR